MNDDDDVHKYRHGTAKPGWPAPPKPSRRAQDTEVNRQARFASEVARSEFGRFYWNDRLDRALKQAMKTKPPRKGGGAKR